MDKIGPIKESLGNVLREQYDTLERECDRRDLFDDDELDEAQRVLAVLAAAIKNLRRP